MLRWKKGNKYMNYDALKLENQLCFPLYACSKEVIKKYKPHLGKIGLTYTQYITMMVLWAEKSITIKDLGKRLYLDSGTLTPMLKNMESAGFIIRKRDKNDERVMNIILTEKGENLKEKAMDIPMKVGQCINLSQKEVVILYGLLYKILNG